MNYTRQLEKGMNGADVRYIKDCLFKLGYYASSIKKISSNTFGNDTVDAVEKYQSKNKDVDGKKLQKDGIVGRKTWNAIVRDFEALKAPKTPSYSKVLKEGMVGEDVRYMKDCLFALKYYEASVKNISNNTFGENTVDAVVLFQKNNKDGDGKQLDDDGKIGSLTWNAIEREFKAGRKYEPPKAPAKPKISLDHLTHISPAHRDAIAKDLAKVSELRQKIVLEILEYACDASYKKEPRGMYQLGANLYNEDLKLNYADKAETERLAKRNPDYFDGGRKEWMLKRIAADPKIPVSDCSGMEVGLLRKYKLVSAKFDTTANGLCGNSYSKGIKKSELMPGDWVGKSGHIGIYVGGGFVVEFYGGAYGCQLTELDNRRGYDFLDKRFEKGSAWTKYRRPKFY